MGGHAAGEVASEMAVEMVSHDLSDLNDLEASDSHDRVAHALRDANRAVYERTRTERDKLGMGSTVSALLLSETRYVVGHVGDSRIYLVRDGQMRQLTKDHSLVQEQVDAGLLTPEQARRHPQSNVITRCIGMADEIEPDVFDGSVRVGDAFLLASDGLTGMVEDRRIQQLLVSRAKPERIVDALIQEANVNGGNDNITAVVVRVLSAESADGGGNGNSREVELRDSRAWVTIATLSRESRSSTSATSSTHSSSPRSVWTSRTRQSMPRSIGELRRSLLRRAAER